METLAIVIIVVVILVVVFAAAGMVWENRHKDSLRGGRGGGGRGGGGRGGGGRGGRGGGGRGGGGRGGRGGGGYHHPRHHRPRRYWGGGLGIPFGLNAGWYGYPYWYDYPYPYGYDYYQPYIRDYADIRPCDGDPTDGRPLCTSSQEDWEVDDRCRAPGMYGDAEYVWHTGPGGEKCYEFNP